MKELSLTNNSTGRATSSGVVSSWSVELRGYHIRFVNWERRLSVEVLSVIDFKYYFGAFSIQESQNTAAKKVVGIPQVIIDKLSSKYIDYYFSKGQLSLQLPYELGRYCRKYTFPPLKQLILHEQLFQEMAQLRTKDFQLRSAKRQIEQLEKEKRIIMDELRCRNRELVNIIHSEDGHWKDRMYQWSHDFLKHKVRKRLLEQVEKTKRDPDRIFTLILLIILAILVAQLV